MERNWPNIAHKPRHSYRWWCSSSTSPCAALLLLLYCYFFLLLLPLRLLLVVVDLYCYPLVRYRISFKFSLFFSLSLSRSCSPPPPPPPPPYIYPAAPEKLPSKVGSILSFPVHGCHSWKREKARVEGADSCIRASAAAAACRLLFLVECVYIYVSICALDSLDFYLAETRGRVVSASSSSVRIYIYI